MATAQAARDLDLNVNVLRSWVRAFREDPMQAFPGEGQQKPDDGEGSQLHRVVCRGKLPKLTRLSIAEVCVRAASRHSALLRAIDVGTNEAPEAKTLGGAIRSTPTERKLVARNRRASALAGVTEAISDFHERTEEYRSSRVRT